MSKEKLCRQRPDISDYVITNNGRIVDPNLLYPYRWVNDESMQILIEGNWDSVESIDFDFQ